MYQVARLVEWTQRERRTLHPRPALSAFTRVFDVLWRGEGGERGEGQRLGH
jgi:hypothetical protein